MCFGKVKIKVFDENIVEWNNRIFFRLNTNVCLVLNILKLKV